MKVQRLSYCRENDGVDLDQDGDLVAYADYLILMQHYKALLNVLKRNPTRIKQSDLIDLIDRLTVLEVMEDRE